MTSLNNGRSGTPLALQKVAKELERTLCFTDVPCGAMEFTKEEAEAETTTTKTNNQQETIQSLTKRLERTFCFSDLRDIDQTQLPKSLRKKSSIAVSNNNKALVDPAEDTDSCTASEDEENHVKTDGAVEVRMNPASQAAAAAAKLPNVVNTEDQSLITDPSALTMPSLQVRLASTNKQPSKSKRFGGLFGRSSSKKNKPNKKRVMRTRQSLWRHAQECEFDSAAFDDPGESVRSSQRPRGFSFRKSVNSSLSSRRDIV